MFEIALKGLKSAKVREIGEKNIKSKLDMSTRNSKKGLKSLRKTAKKLDRLEAS